MCWACASVLVDPTPMAQQAGMHDLPPSLTTGILLASIKAVLTKKYHVVCPCLPHDLAATAAPNWRLTGRYLSGTEGLHPLDLLLKVCPYAIVQLLPVIAFSEWPALPAGYRICVPCAILFAPPCDTRLLSDARRICHAIGEGRHLQRSTACAAGSLSRLFGTHSGRVS